MDFKTMGSKKITISGGPISLGTPYPAGSLKVNRVDVQALSSNTSPVVVGDSDIAQDASNGGIELVPGQVYNIELISDLRNIFINGTPGDAVSINWWIGDRV